MEEAKREKEEKKNYNLQSGKNVDIDFEIMIEKSRFKEKMLSPHANSSELKVSPPLYSSQLSSANDQSSRRRSREARSTPFPALIHRLKCMNPSTRSMASPSTWKTTYLPSTTPSTNRKYPSHHLGNSRDVQIGHETATAAGDKAGNRDLFRLRPDWFWEDLHNERTAIADSKRAVRAGEEELHCDSELLLNLRWTLSRPSQREERPQHPGG
jgi:hypothetical protein